MTATVSAEAPASTAKKSGSASTRITSIDALRGLVMFTMIFVNDLAGAPHSLTPDWMVHYSDRHQGSGMTFVDLVFPAFLFIVGMSIPFALGGRMAKGEPLWKTVLHILTRAGALLMLGILMVNESPSRQQLGWSPALWVTLMFLSAMFAFCAIGPAGAEKSGGKFSKWKVANLTLRFVGFAGLLWLAFAFRGREGERILSLSPFHINTEWYGILGLIGWAYLAASIVYLVFRTHRTAILGCVVLMTCFYAAGRKGFFNGFWLNDYVNLGGTLGSQAAITVAGLLLASILVAPDKRTHGSRASFTLLFIGGFAFAAILLNGLYGISKNNATPSWCLWASAITAALWLVFYFLADVVSVTKPLTKPFAIAGENVLLAYLISEMLPSLLNLLGLSQWYGSLASASLTGAVTRSILCAVVILSITAALNRGGFRLKL